MSAPLARDMTTFLLIRHGAHDLLGRTLTGRTRDVHLNTVGKRQAQWLAERMRGFRVDAVLSSPLTRCMETASPIAAALGLSVEPLEAANEVDFGSWSGFDFSELQNVPRWKRYNHVRSMVPPPEGETVLSVQMRVLSGLEKLCQSYPDGCVAVVSHADVIKAILAYCLGMPIDLFHRLEITPGSFSMLRLGGDEPRILCLNVTMPDNRHRH